MNKILCLRKRRADLWNDAKRFLEEHRDQNGLICKEYEEIYNKMVADVISLGLEIERLESQARIDRSILKESLIESIKPIYRQGKVYCGVCGKRIPRKIKAHYCHKCGTKIN